MNAWKMENLVNKRAAERAKIRSVRHSKNILS